jgi:hypothetical protein
MQQHMVLCTTPPTVLLVAANIHHLMHPHAYEYKPPSRRTSQQMMLTHCMPPHMPRRHQQTKEGGTNKQMQGHHAKDTWLKPTKVHLLFWAAHVNNITPQPHHHSCYYCRCESNTLWAMYCTQIMLQPAKQNKVSSYCLLLLTLAQTVLLTQTQSHNLPHLHRPCFPTHTPISK